MMNTKQKIDKTYLNDFVARSIAESPLNYISAEKALRPDLAGLKIFGDFLIGYAAADDGIWEVFASGDARLKMLRPTEWLPGAKTVISIFLHYTKRIRASNTGGDWPSPEWFHGRIEGQGFGDDLVARLRDGLAAAGHEALIPAKDPRFAIAKSDTGYSAEWSERHAAYAAGLGTFSLSKGLITEKGTAGRFGSIVTTLELPAEARAYRGITDYCSMCGKCVRNCPVNAIDLRAGKNDALCSAFLDKTRERMAPYYGCGKCECGVPCEGKRPKRSH
jgi:epoxyqueuosine reductase QueG